MQEKKVSQAKAPLPDFRGHYIFVARFDMLYDLRTRAYVTVRAVGRRYAAEIPEKIHPAAYILETEGAVGKADAATFAPGRPPLFVKDDVTFLNLWTKNPLEPVEGNIAPFLDHLAFLFDDDATATGYVLDWLADVVQNPAAKPSTAVLLIGGQGLGKSLLGTMLAELVGLDNTAPISSGMLVGPFNEWLAHAKLVVVHELCGEGGRPAKAKLKGLITDHEVYLNCKGLSAVRWPNVAAFFLLSNEEDAADLDADDRRFFVWKSQARPRPQAYYAEFANWFFNDGGRAHVLHALQSRDLSSFSRHAPPPRTRARDELAAGSRSEVETYLSEALDAGEAPFLLDLVVIQHVLDFMSWSRHMRPQQKEVAAFLRKVGAAELGQKRLSDGTKPRLWAVRRQAFWMSASEDDIRQHYRKPADALPVAVETAMRSAVQPSRLARRNG